MNRENKFLLLNTLILLVISAIVVLVYSNIALTTKADKIFGTKVKLEAVEGNLPEKINEAYDVYKGELKVGHYFDVSETSDYGSLSLLVGIDNENKIIGIYQAIDQNYPKEHHQEEVYLYVEALIGSNINNPENLDGVAKPTTLVTLGSIDSLLESIAKYIEGDDKEPQEPKAEIEFVGVVTEGRKYKVTKESTFVGASKGTLSFNVVVDSDGVIVSYEELEYGHSGDGFKETAIEFFDSLVGKDINSLTNSELDGHTGSTNSRTAILDLLYDLADFIENEPEDVVVFVEEVEGNRKYKLTKESTFVGASKGTLSFNVVIDDEDKLVSYEIIKYNHSDGNFQATALTFFDSLIGRDINTLTDSELDGHTGSTNSRTAILDLLYELKTYIEGEE